MSKSELTKWVGTAGSVLLAYALVLNQTAWAAQSVKTNGKQSAATAAKTETAESASSKKAAAEGKSPRDGTNEGIKVHGHWTIEVRNPDGSVVQHKEFENSIFQGSNGGGTLLSLLLSRQTLTGWWEIVLAPAGGGPPAIYLDESGEPVGISRPANFGCQTTTCAFGNDLSFAGGVFATGVYTGGTFTLTGSAVAPTGFTIGQVVAGNFPCFGTQVATIVLNGVPTPASELQSCAAIGNFDNNQPSTRSAIFLNFTSRMLDGQNGDPSPVTVNQGQTVAVTVNITFS